MLKNTDYIVAIVVFLVSHLIYRIYSRKRLIKRCKVIEKEFIFLQDKFGFKVTNRKVVYGVYFVTWKTNDFDNIGIDVGCSLTIDDHRSLFINVYGNSPFHKILSYQEDSKLIGTEPIKRLNIAAEWLESHMNGIS